MRILYVCTANICRSASAAALMGDQVRKHAALAGIEVASAGTHAGAGRPGCAVAPALAGRAQAHRSQLLTPALVAWADLVLAASRDHRSAVVLMDPAARPRTFTLRQAGRIAAWLTGSGMVAAARAGDAQRHDPADPRSHVMPLGTGERELTRWVVAELDAGRGSSVGIPGPAPGARRRPWRPRSDQPIPPDDVPDPHVLGMGLHPVAYEHIREATELLVALLLEVRQPPMPQPDVAPGGQGRAPDA